MAYDLKGADGELDRGKVIAELDKILDRLPSPPGFLLDSIRRRERQNIINLIDEAVGHAFVEGEHWVRGEDRF